MFCSLSIQAFAQDGYDAKVRDYIIKYKDLAVAEQKRSGIPAAVTLAQGIHETSAGASELATVANNHFGIKCKKTWTGLTFKYSDDAPDECFRKYLRPEDSYVDHSDYLVTNPRYASLFTCAATDYKSWATGLKKCGYATNPKYPQILIRIIEDYELQEYTYAAMKTTKDNAPAIVKELVPENDAVVSAPKEIMDAAVTPPPYGVVVKINNLKAVYAKKGDMPLEYAMKNNIRYERLLEFNEIDERPLPTDMFLYLERKNSRGVVPSHKVKEGETLAQIAQIESIQLHNLRTYNHLKPGEEPIPGAILDLQKMTFKKPATIPSSNPTPATFTSKSNIKVTEDVPLAANIEIAPIEEIDIDKKPKAEGELLAISAEEISITYGDVSTSPETPESANGNSLISSNDVVKSDVSTPASPVGGETPIGKSNLPPKPPVIYFEKNEIEEPAKTELGPPASVYDIPAKPLESPKPVEIALAKTVEEPVTQSPPKSELDLLKSKFDKVVYSKPVVASPVPPIVAEVPKAEEVNVTVATHQAIASGAPKYYIVKKGDTAFSIAKANGISVRELREWNGLDFDAIKLGQKLKVKQ